MSKPRSNFALYPAVIFLGVYFSPSTLAQEPQPQAGSASTNTKAKHLHISRTGVAKPPAAIGGMTVSDAKTATVPVTIPEVPLRPAQMPPVAPRISYENGILTVVAENCTLSDVLSGIHKITGIKFENTGGSNNERVAAKIGPAPVREVLLSLLQGSHYGYAILGSLDDPAVVERVLLIPRMEVGGNTTQPAPQTANQVTPASVRQQPVENDADEESDGFAEPAPQPLPPAPAGAQPSAPPPTGQVKTD